MDYHFIMDKFIINGRERISGEIAAFGSKNAATPLLAAALMTEQPCTIGNLPKIEDVLRMIDLMKSIGVLIEWIGDDKVRVISKDIDIGRMDNESVCKMRSSVLLWGALVGRVGKKFSTGLPGGCIIGARIFDPHIKALEGLGIKITVSDKEVNFESKGLTGADLTMSEISVTATENAILAAVRAKGKTIIRCAAYEPHVQCLCFFLKKMGARISGIGSSTLTIDGVDVLAGAEMELIPDANEMGTFISMFCASGGRGLVKNVVAEFIPMELQKMREAGAGIKFFEKEKKLWGFIQGDIEVDGIKQIQAIKKVHNMPYPGFAADNLPPFAVMMSQAYGETLIHDWMYEGRMNYLTDLQKMGAKVKIINSHEAVISGPAGLSGKKIKSYDLRAGASLIIAAIIAEGTSEIGDVHQVDRGYEKIEERLRQIGVNIKRVAIESE